MSKYIFFDLDGTLTESKQKISKEMKEILKNLKSPFAVISGASREQMEWQLDGLKCEILAQSGNDNRLWKNELTMEEIQKIQWHIFNYSCAVEPHYDNRGSQIAQSLIGHHQPKDQKANFDPKQKIRQSILKQHPFKSKTLTVRIAGTTCFDYTHKNGTKGKNIARWIKANKLDKKDCIYYGDALFKGGNDESVKGVIKCIAVKNPTDLIKKL